MPIYLAESVSSNAVSGAAAATSNIVSGAQAATSAIGSAVQAGASAVTGGDKEKSAAPSFRAALGSWSFIPIILGLVGLVASV